MRKDVLEKQQTERSKLFPCEYGVWNTFRRNGGVGWFIGATYYDTERHFLCVAAKVSRFYATYEQAQAALPSMKEVAA